MGGEEVFHNAFAAFGIVPDKYGHRTLLEHRAVLVSLPPSDPTSQQRPSTTADPALQNGSAAQHPILIPPSNAEVESALRHLGATLDAAGMSSIDPRYLVTLRALGLPQPSSGHRNLSRLTNASPNLILARPERAPAPSGPVARVRAALDAAVGAHPYAAPHPSILSWHCTDERVAVATSDDCVCVYNARRGEWEHPPLAAATVRAIACIAFRPCGGATIAIGCAAGVALWSTARGLVWLVHPGHTNVVALDWSPDGAQLVSTSADDGGARLWDVGTRTSAAAGAGGLARFCPRPGADVVLIASATRAAFRLVAVADWAVERWGALAGPVRAAAWAPDGKLLMIAAGSEGALHVLRVEHGPRATTTDLAHTEITTVPRTGPGGAAKYIAWDPHGERVAVVFETPTEDAAAEPVAAPQHGFAMDENRRYAVALYATQLEPTFQISPVGYVSGPPSSGPPSGICFKPRCEGRTGAVLAVAWGSGAVTFTQLIFKPAQASAQGRNT